MYEIQYDLDPLPKDSSPKNRNSVIYSALCYSEAMWLLIWITNEGNTAERIMVWCKNVICLSQKNSCETTWQSTFELNDIWVSVIFVLYIYIYIYIYIHTYIHTVMANTIGTLDKYDQKLWKLLILLTFY